MLSSSQVMSLYDALEPWAIPVGVPFRKGEGHGLDGARRVVLAHCATHANARAAAVGATRAIQGAANYGRNFNDTKCSEWLGFPHSNRELRKQLRILGVTEDEFQEMFANVIFATGFLEQYPDPESVWVKLWKFDDDDMIDAATTLLVLRLRLTCVGKMPYPSFATSAEH